MNTIKAIETVYKGYRFRSRLEARWAVVFDTLGVKWEYEKEGFNLDPEGAGFYYLPDFWLPEFELWVEVKGVPKPEDYIKLTRLCYLSGPGTDSVVVSEIPDDPDETPVVLGCIEIDIEPSEPEEAVHKLFSGGHAYGGEYNMTCPVCGTDYVFFTGDEPGGADYDRYRMSGECMHSWTLCFNFHKGVTLVFLEDIIETNGHLAVVLAKGNKELDRKALLAGRQARFEHGEKG